MKKPKNMVEMWAEEFSTLISEGMKQILKKERKIIMIGTVKKFNNEKGYGFITCEGYDKDIFAHYSQIVMEGYKTLVPEQIVEFDLVETEKGIQANNIVVMLSSKH